MERRGRKERNVEEGRWPQAAASPRRPLGTLVGVPVHLIDGSSSSFLPQAGASRQQPWSMDRGRRQKLLQEMTGTRPPPARVTDGDGPLPRPPRRV